MPQRPTPLGLSVTATVGDSAAAVGRVAARIRVEGTVQGVGFRPFVFRLATEAGLAGWVTNDCDGVCVHVEGCLEAVEGFVAAIGKGPPSSTVTQVSVCMVEPSGCTDFRIAATSADGTVETAVPSDTATCPSCLAELRDRSDRRFGYPFVNCTDCGPRYTIVTAMPYDRERTTMARFEMCPTCAREYLDPTDRRFHAEPVCCPQCGPRLDLIGVGRGRPADPLGEAVRLLREGRILAVKGLGGYHLAALAGCEEAVSALRGRKVREEKPFAVMVADLRAAGSLCEVDRAEAELLCHPARPIVLLRRADGSAVAGAVAPGTRWLGLMLPYTPLHHLLIERVGAPLVMTSGNRSDEPIAFDDGDAADRLSGIADAFLVHDRPIHVRTDDSVARVVDGSTMMLRRSRGYVPSPLRLPHAARRPLLACGGQLKNTFCLARGDRAVLSHHIGDLQDAATYRSWIAGIEHAEQLLDIRPEVVAHDLHPEYLSTKFAEELEGVELMGVQHHHAHIASCLADNEDRGPVIGAAFDGFGWGPDGTLWGGEILHADLASYRRIGGLAPVPLPGGTAAVREPWRMAVSYLLAAYGPDLPAGMDVLERHRDRWEEVARLSTSGQCLLTSSAGRLFDALAALVGVRDRASYEGQAAVDLEQQADPDETGGYPASVATDGFAIDGLGLFRAAVEDLRSGASPPTVAARFHHGLADATAEACTAAARHTDVGTVALSGGVFQNVLLLRRTRDRLRRAGLRVLVHRHVPPNDGGLSLGQAAVAAARQHDAVSAVGT